MMYLDECIGSTHARPIGNNSHESFAILFVESYLESKIPEDECFEFENKIRELREQRNIADYKFKKCNINDSLNLLTNAENLIKILITKFNIIRYGN